MKTPTTEEKILVHLARFPHGAYSKGAVPYALTQSGISESIGVPRNYVAVVLGRMAKSGREYFFSETHRIRGYPKKRKVYFLTSEGMREANNIIKKWKNEKVKVSVSGEIHEVKLCDIGSYLQCDDCVYFGIERMDENGVIAQKRRNEKEEQIFVGRELEIKKFRVTLEALAAGKGSCVFISGDPGLGKTTLALKFGTMAKKREYVFLQGRGYPNLSAPYLPLDEMLRNEEVQMKNRKKILGIIKKVGTLPEEGGESIEYQRIAMWHDLLDELRKISKERPIVIFIDDLQWVDPTSLNLLYFLCSHIRNLKMVVIGAYRSSWSVDILGPIKSALIREKVLKTINLKVMQYGEIKRLLTLITGSEVPASFVNLIKEITGGNPLFIVEILKKMLDEGLLNPQDGKYPQSLVDFTVPESIEAIINERVKNLTENARRVLQISSVIGYNIPYSLLKKVSELKDTELLDALDILIEERMLSSLSSNVFTFIHPLMPMVVYQNMHTSVRMLYHRKVAESIGMLIKKNKDIETLVDLGYQYEMGGEPIKAIDYYYDKALAAGEIYAYEDSIRILERALSLSKEIGDKDRTCRVANALGDMQHRKGSYGDALASYQTAISSSEDLKMLKELYLKMAIVQRESGKLKEAMESIEQRLSHHGSDSITVRLLSEKIWLLMKMGEFQEAEKNLEIMEDVAHKLEDYRASALVMENKATILYYNGKYEEAKKYLLEAISFQEKSEDKYYLSVLYTNLGILLAQTGHLSEAVKYFDKSKRIEEVYNTQYGLAQVNTNLGIVHHKRGRLNKALNYFKKAQEIYKKIESFDSLAVSYIDIGNILIEQGLFEEALSYIKSAESIFTNNSDLWGLCHAYLAIADTYIYLKLYKKASEYIEKTMGIANKINNKGCILESEVLLLRLKIETKSQDASESIRKIEENKDSFDTELSAKVDYLTGLYYLKNDKYSDAEAKLKSAYNKYKEYGEVINLAHVECAWAQLLEKMGREGEMRKKYERALKYFESEHMNYWINKCNIFRIT